MRKLDRLGYTSYYIESRSVQTIPSPIGSTCKSICQPGERWFVGNNDTAIWVPNSRQEGGKSMELYHKDADIDLRINSRCRSDRSAYTALRHEDRSGPVRSVAGERLRNLGSASI